MHVYWYIWGPIRPKIQYYLYEYIITVLVYIVLKLKYIVCVYIQY